MTWAARRPMMYKLLLHAYSHRSLLRRVTLTFELDCGDWTDFEAWQGNGLVHHLLGLILASCFVD